MEQLIRRMTGRLHCLQLSNDFFFFLKKTSLNFKYLTFLFIWDHWGNHYYPLLCLTLLFGHRLSNTEVQDCWMLHFMGRVVGGKY
ncbi:hypothetical protein AGOR_G00158460 [Albula goreensis]|uniref:Uncharacterized protein n=1 Tax=Albula goreensis TaxID=1534307 RepID=A0A8T3D4I3_9TELE|nr:hypothetical protein AGOR_G00158460 [Albula goreensis]